MKSGYLYVLVHPSDPDLYKIGVTTKTPEERLAKHNSVYAELTGQIVKETGRKWELKTYIEVEDHYFAEKAFWAATYLADIPFRGGVEVYRMEWSEVLKGLEAAKRAGVRPPPGPPSTAVRNAEWMVKQLEGTGITFERYRGLVRGTDFKCEKGHEFTESAGVVAYHKSCPLCGPDYRAPWRRAESSRL